MSEKKTGPVMGKALTVLGLLIKTAQIICVSLGVYEMGNTVWTAISACFLAGGLIIFGMEKKKKKTAVFADIAAVCILMTLIKTSIKLFIYIPLFLMFLCFALIMFSLKKKVRIFGLLIIVLTAVLVLCVFKVITLSILPGTVLLTAIYVFTAIGICM